MPSLIEEIFEETNEKPLTELSELLNNNKTNQESIESIKVEEVKDIQSLDVATGKYESNSSKILNSGPR